MTPRWYASLAAAAMLAASILAASAMAARGKDWPQRPVEVTVPFSPGAVTDVLGRAFAEGLSGELGQRFIVVNKSGATGAIGAAAVARAAPDGYALVFTPAVSIIVLPLTNRQVGYNLGSFEPICQTFKNEMVMVVNQASPFHTVGELVAAARAKPGAVNYGHLGVGSIPHLAMIEFSQVAKVEFNAIPFKGDADVMGQVVGGQLDFGAMVLSSAAGSSLRILGLFAEHRNPATPDTPTVKEQGFAVAPSSFGGLMAPAGLPPAVKAKLAAACSAAAQGDSYRRLARTVFQPDDYYADSAAFATNLANDIEDKRRLLKLIGEVK
jgi:tripartite-type tricarboxylate transporter receptor subunit TctC